MNFKIIFLAATLLYHQFVFARLVRDTIIVEQDTMVICSSYAKVGYLQSVYTTKDSKFHGFYKEWYKDGQLRSISKYDLDKIIDTSFSYYRSGNLKSRLCTNGWNLQLADDGDTLGLGFRESGRIIGVYKSWYRKGWKEDFTNYNSSGKKHGLSQRWREDGTRKDSTIYENGIVKESMKYFRTGTSRYFCTGTPRYFYTYEDDEKWSIRTWSPDGKKTGTVTNGNGEILLYSEDLKEKEKIRYREGWILSREKYVNDTLVSEMGNFLDGSSRFHMGYKDGLAEKGCFYQFGNKGKKHYIERGKGFGIYYTEDGANRYVREYRNGKLILNRKLTSEEKDIAAAMEDSVKNIIGSFIIAMRRNNLSAVKELIENGVDVNLQLDHTATALHFAANHGKVEIVEYLLSAGADINARDGHGRTALYLAYVMKQKETVKLLLEKTGIFNNPESGSWTGGGLMFEAAKADDLEFLKYLVSKGADLYAYNYDGANVFHVACGKGALSVIQYLLKKAETLKNTKDGTGYNALHWATLSDSCYVVTRLLFENGIDRSLLLQKSDYRQTPYDMAVKNGREKAVVYLKKIMDRVGSKSKID